MVYCGWLNVLVNIFGKFFEVIFSEFDSKEYDEEELFDGDVKYYMGWISFCFIDKGKKVWMDLVLNFLYLEIVNVVVEGIVRVKLDNKWVGDEKKIFFILIYGDVVIVG